MSEEVKKIKSDRVMQLLFRAMKGERLSVQNLAEEYHVSARSITRDINSLKVFLSDYNGTLGNCELEYSSSDHSYSIRMETFLTNRELVAVTKVLIGCRAFNQEDILELLRKLKMHTSAADRSRLELLIRNEIYHYTEIHSDCPSVIDQVWKLTDCIRNRSVITIRYFKMSREYVTRKIKPVSIMFSEYYFYLIAYKCDTDTPDIPFYFRIDRITDMTIHRETYKLTDSQKVEEGELRRKSQFMWPGPTRHIRFAFSGPSKDAIKDRIPTAKVVDTVDGRTIFEAEVFGDGIKMFLLSQGSWVEVLSPPSFVEEMKEEIANMQALYN